MFARQAIYGLIAGMVGRRYMIYMGAYEVGDIWANRWCGREAVDDIFGSLAGRRYMGLSWVW